MGWKELGIAVAVPLCGGILSGLLGSRAEMYVMLNSCIFFPRHWLSCYFDESYVAPLSSVLFICVCAASIDTLTTSAAPGISI